MICKKKQPTDSKTKSADQITQQGTCSWRTQRARKATLLKGKRQHEWPTSTRKEVQSWSLQPWRKHERDSERWHCTSHRIFTKTEWYYQKPTNPPSSWHMCKVRWPFQERAGKLLFKKHHCSTATPPCNTPHHLPWRNYELCPHKSPYTIAHADLSELVPSGR